MLGRASFMRTCIWLPAGHLAGLQARLAVMEKTTRSLPKELSPVALFGPADINLRALERAFPTLEITVRGSEVQARGAGKDVAAFEKLLEQLVLLVERGQEVTPQGLEQSLKMLQELQMKH